MVTSVTTDVVSLLRLAKSKSASDLHLVAFSPPLFRVDGLLKPAAGMEPLTPNDTRSCFEQIATEKQKSDFYQHLELDFGYGIEDVGRLRCNVAMQRGTVTMVIRLLPMAIATVDDLKLPQVCKELVLRRSGMIVVSGPTGSGKSTTLAAMLDHLNNTETRRVVTIEDPVEYVYSSRKCTFTQRELGSDTFSFAEALKHVLRQDPDVILIGEMRDPDTAAAALTIAETGHLVLTTGHAGSSPGAMERIIDLFPIDERALAQSRLSTLILGVLCQALVPLTQERGRIVATEIMLANSAVRNLIREGKIFQLPNAIRTGANDGMRLLDQSLIDFYRKGTIDRQSLFSFANEPEHLEDLLQLDGRSIS